MRILLDESLPIELQAELPGHDVQTVKDVGWAGLKNGELLARTADRFEILVTADQNLRYRQNLSKLPVAVVILVAKSNRIDDLRPLIPDSSAYCRHFTRERWCMSGPNRAVNRTPIAAVQKARGWSAPVTLPR